MVANLKLLPLGIPASSGAGGCQRYAWSRLGGILGRLYGNSSRSFDQLCLRLAEQNLGSGTSSVPMGADMDEPSLTKPRTCQTSRSQQQILLPMTHPTRQETANLVQYHSPEEKGPFCRAKKRLSVSFCHPLFARVTLNCVVPAGCNYNATRSGDHESSPSLSK